MQLRMKRFRLLNMSRVPNVQSPSLTRCQSVNWNKNREKNCIERNEKKEDDDCFRLSINFDTSQGTFLKKSPVASFAWDSTLKAEALNFV